MIYNTNTSWRRRSLKRVPRSDICYKIQRAFLSTCAGTILFIMSVFIRYAANTNVETKQKYEDLCKYVPLDLYIPCLIEFLTMLWGMLRLVYPMSYRVPYNVMGYLTTCISHVL